MKKAVFLSLGCAVLVVLVVLGAWAWTPDRSRNDLNARYLGASTRYLEAAGALLRVRDTGPKTAPAIIFMHGFGSSLETWESWATALDGRYRVVRFDFPGCGLSAADPTGQYADARSMDIVNALMDRLGMERAVLIGNSMGGRIAWKFAAAFPARVRKLVLISPDGFASPGFEYGRKPDVPRALWLMRYFLPKSMLRANLAAAYADPSRLGDAVVDRYHDMMLAPGNRAATLDRMGQTVLDDPRPILPRIAAPTLLIWGRQDHMIPYSNAADYLALLSDATLVSLPDLGHVPQEEAPAESLVPLERFLAH